MFHEQGELEERRFCLVYGEKIATGGARTTYERRRFQQAGCSGSRQRQGDVDHWNPPARRGLSNKVRRE